MMMESGISQYNSPSFSSTLLDAIYRSIDHGEDEIVMRKKQNHNGGGGGANVRGVCKSEEEMANFQRACMIEKWMEKKATEKAVVRRKSAGAADSQTKKPRKSDRPASSSWSSSDSSGGGFFEAEPFPLPRPKPVRTGGLGFEKDLKTKIAQNRGRDLDPKPKHEGGFLKTKSRALKIYGDLKKVKQPISPGGKLAGFLNSLFAGAGKPKTAGDDSPSLKSTNASSTCSSTSSFSRSCLSKTPSSRGKSSNGAKRSVRFSPVSVIVDEDCQPCGHKSLLDDINNNNNNKHASKFEVIAKNDHNNMKSIRNVINEELMVHMMEKNRRVEEVARDLLRNYQKKTQMECEFEFSFDNLRKSHVKNQSAFDQDFDVEEDDDDGDDAASYASSDLFELDNLSAIGMERYREELPVYETTHLEHSNRAGLIY